jgi:hypothetical protein
MSDLTRASEVAPVQNGHCENAPACSWYTTRSASFSYAAGNGELWNHSKRPKAGQVYLCLGHAPAALLHRVLVPLNEAACAQRGQPIGPLPAKTMKARKRTDVDLLAVQGGAEGIQIRRAVATGRAQLRCLPAGVP